MMNLAIHHSPFVISNVNMVNYSQTIQITKEWIQQFVINLNLCPFAKHPFNAGTIRYTVFEGNDLESFLKTILEELTFLNETDASVCETSLLIHPEMFPDFSEYWDFQDVIDDILEECELDGVFQVATFHPDYQFDGTRKASPENYTNRSPFPMLHFLREDSVTKAVDTYPNVDDIPIRNIRIMNNLGSLKIKLMLNEITGKN
jgi:hypothetical protein